MDGSQERTSGNETEKHHNIRLKQAYKIAYYRYKAACERYDKLVQAYNILNKFRTENQDTKLPQTERIIKGMIEDAKREKKIIAEHAKECMQHLRTIRCEYEM